MSAKWRQVKAWDEANLTGPMTPLRWILTAFSSITLAVTFLVVIAIYGTLASVPIGFLALIPTKLFYLVLFVLAVGICATVGFFAGRQMANTFDVGRRSRELRFFFTLVPLLVGTVVGYWAWSRIIAPVVVYEPAIPSLDQPERGIQFFSGFVNAYKSTLLRQMPSWEMSELEFYGWWPFKLVLILFVINMITATVRRIEFKFVNIGVLTVHTGIVTIAMGSIFYQRGKVEGDIRLVKGMPPKSVFYDAIIPAIYLWNDQGNLWFVHALPGLPRYNDATAGTPYAPNFPLHAQTGFDKIFPRTLEVNVKGIIPYGDVKATWIKGGTAFNPSVNVALHVHGDDGRDFDWSKRLIGAIATHRALGAADLPGLSITHLVKPGAQRVSELLTEFPSPGNHAFIVRVPDSNFQQVYTVSEGQHLDVGDTGWKIDVTEFQSRDEGLALISKGYEGARSSRARIEITAPDGTVSQRSVIHQYPELTQDFTLDPNGGMPRRTAPDPRIQIVYLDASQMYLWIVQDDPSTAQARVIERAPGGQISAFDVSDGDSVTGQVGPTSMKFTFTDFWPRTSQRFDVVSVPRSEQERDARGTYFYAYLDVEISLTQADGTVATQRRWLPFNQYLDQDYPFTRIEQVTLPEVGTISLAFGRLRHTFPDLALALHDFRMIPYPGTNQPRDYQSTLDVYVINPGDDKPVQSEHVTKLNHPYIFRRKPAGALASIMGFFVPDQYKFSQAGWDPQRQQYTVLGVGNNPGIYVIAFGGILMGLGIPWAFYVKPAILKHRRRKIERAIAQGDHQPLPPRPVPAPAHKHNHQQTPQQQPSQTSKALS